MEAKKAIILAAGKGTRLDRVDSPKPLVHVGSQPMLLRIIKQLQDARVDDITIVVGHRGDEIRRELLGNKHITANITFADQIEDASEKGLVHSFLALEEESKDPVIVTMADLVFLDNPFTHLCEESIKNIDGNEIHTLVCTDLRHAGTSGALSRVDITDKRVAKIGRDLPEHSGVEVGAYFAPRGLQSVAEHAKKNKSADFESLLASLATENKLGYVTWNESPWFDVNTPATHTRANMLIRELEHTISVDGVDRKRETLKIYSTFDREKLMKSDIVVARGLVKNISEYELIPPHKAKSPHFILTDDRVNTYYGDLVLNALRSEGYNIRKIVVPEGESSKNISVYSDVADQIFSYGIDKHSIIISLGGGVINNLAGVLASTLYRGIELMHISTSSMSQVDAALDFKQAINSRMGKNLIGSYHPASKIVIDPEVLLTLDDRHLRNGIAESLKHALTQSGTFVKELMTYADNLNDVDVLEDIIKQTVDLKVPLLNGAVEDDFNEMLPQYGHSVAHAVEHLSAYDLYHGEAVTIGMCVTSEISKLLGFCDDETVAMHYKLAELYKLPTVVPASMTAEDICEKIRYDKHYVKGCPHMALPTGIGEMWHNKGVYSVPVEYEVLKRAISINKSKARV